VNDEASSNGTGAAATAGGADNGGRALTVAEAGVVLNVSERRLRRLLERPEYAARTMAQTRRTRTGTRTGAALPPALLHDLAAVIEHEENAANAAGTRQERGEGGGRKSDSTDTAAEGDPLTAGQLVPLYQRLLTEKDTRIGELTAALEHEREQSRRLADALAREQTLRALPAPPAAPREPETGRTSDDTRNGAEGPQRGTETAKPRASWWGRLLKRGEG